MSSISRENVVSMGRAVKEIAQGRLILKKSHITGKKPHGHPLRAL